MVIPLHHIVCFSTLGVCSACFSYVVFLLYTLVALADSQSFYVIFFGTEV